MIAKRKNKKQQIKLIKVEKKKNQQKHNIQMLFKS